MTLVRNAAGGYEGDFRAKGVPRLRLSMRTTKRGEARTRHDAVQLLVRQRRVEMLEQLRAGVLTVERVVAMVEGGEPLVPIAAPQPAPDAAAETPVSTVSPWGTVGEAAERYLAWLTAHPRKSDRTHTLSASELRRFLAFSWEGREIRDWPLDGVPSAAILAYQTGLLATKKLNTVTGYMTRVGALWRWAASEEARAAHEARRAARPLWSPVRDDMRVREHTARERFLTSEEAERLLAATPEPLLAIVALALLAGLRLGEALHLSPRDVDVEIGLVSIREKVLPDGTVWKPKTKRSRRSVPIADALRPLLEHHIAHVANDAWLTPRAADAAWPIAGRTFDGHFRAIVLRAGLPIGRSDPSGVTLHVLRHTFASWLVMRGVDLYTVAQLLGDTLQTVEDTYAHLSPDHKRQAIGALAGAVNIPAAKGPAENDTASAPTEGQMP